jgi:hypothetical protein
MELHVLQSVLESKLMRRLNRLIEVSKKGMTSDESRMLPKELRFVHAAK